MFYSLFSVYLSGLFQGPLVSRYEIKVHIGDSGSFCLTNLKKVDTQSNKLNVIVKQ